MGVATVNNPCTNITWGPMVGIVHRAAGTNAPAIRLPGKKLNLMVVGQEFKLESGDSERVIN